MFMCIMVTLPTLGHRGLGMMAKLPMLFKKYSECSEWLEQIENTSPGVVASTPCAYGASGPVEGRKPP